MITASGIHPVVLPHEEPSACSTRSRGTSPTATSSSCESSRSTRRSTCGARCRP